MGLFKPRNLSTSSTTSAVNVVRRQSSQHRPKPNAPAATRDCPLSKQRNLRLGCITQLDPRCRETCWRVNRRRSRKSETESLWRPEKIERKFAHSRLPQGMLRVLDRRIGQCWEATPCRVITAPSRCRRQVPLAFGHNAINPRGLGAEPPRTPSICLFIHLLS